MSANVLTRLEVDENGIRLSRFGKVLLKLDYQEIKVIGIGEGYGIKGKKKKLYFSPRKLEARELANLDLVQHQVIYFSSISEELYHYIEEKCGIEFNDPLLQDIFEKR